MNESFELLLLHRRYGKITAFGATDFSALSGVKMTLSSDFFHQFSGFGDAESSGNGFFRFQFSHTRE